MKYIRYLILLLFLHPCFGNAQKDLDLGEVRFDSNFNCLAGNMMFRDSFPFGVGEICDSKNYMEIRLRIFDSPRGQMELIILSYDNNKWDAKRYVSKPGIVSRVLEITALTPDRYDIGVDLFLSSIFDTLKKNNIFLLPDQTEMKNKEDYLKITLHRAPFHIIKFKVGNEFRSYKYVNLGFCFVNFPDVPEYKNLKAIITGIQSIF